MRARSTARRAARGLVAACAVVLTVGGGLVATGTAAEAAVSTTDKDGDGLPDVWETTGDTNGDGRVDLDLKKLGASPTHKDVFVEMDHMSGYLPTKATLDRIVKVFADAPVSNPDGTTGVRIHLDAGPAVASYDFGGGNQVATDRDLAPAEQQTLAIKKKNFAPARSAAFHYMLWARQYDGGCSSGVSFEMPGDTFVVSLGCQSRTADQQVGTFVHELGHDLGLDHGGADDDNYKPNYLSVMNYAFQFAGVPRTSGASSFGYSSVAPPRLDERSLVESVGLNSAGAAGFQTVWYCPGERADQSDPVKVAPARGPIDWDCDGRTNETSRTDVNGDGYRSTLAATNDWDRLRYDGGAVGGPGTRGRTRSGAAEPSGSQLRATELSLRHGLRVWQLRHRHH